MGPPLVIWVSMVSVSVLGAVPCKDGTFQHVNDCKALLAECRERTYETVGIANYSILASCRNRSAEVSLLSNYCADICELKEFLQQCGFTCCDAKVACESNRSASSAPEVNAANPKHVFNFLSWLSASPPEWPSVTGAILGAVSAALLLTFLYIYFYLKKSRKSEHKRTGKSKAVSFQIEVCEYGVEESAILLPSSVVEEYVRAPLQPVSHEISGPHVVDVEVLQGDI